MFTTHEAIRLVQKYGIPADSSWPLPKPKPKPKPTPALRIELRIAVAREGFTFARQHRDQWFTAVNRCPYGPALADGGGDVRAHAWYEGFWFFFYVVKPWSEVICGKQN